MIRKQTAEKIWVCYREIEAGEKLLADMENARQEQLGNSFAPTLQDSFGRQRSIELGIPSGENGHRLFSVSPVLAESCILAHISNKRTELEELNECARIELVSV